MRVVSWNVQGVFADRPYDEKIARHVDFIDSLDPSPDVVLLQEVSTVRPDLWRSLLRDEVGYEGIVDTFDWAEELGESNILPHDDICHSNGNLTAVRDPGSIELVRPSIREGPYDDDDLKHFGTNFPEKILVSTFQGQDIELELWNIRAVPGNSWGEEKLKIFETVYNRLITDGRRPHVLAGDFNSPAD